MFKFNTKFCVSFNMVFHNDIDDDHESETTISFTLQIAVCCLAFGTFFLLHINSTRPLENIFWFHLRNTKFAIIAWIILLLIMKLFIPVQMQSGVYVWGKMLRSSLLLKVFSSSFFFNSFDSFDIEKESRKFISCRLYVLAIFLCCISVFSCAIVSLHYWRNRRLSFCCCFESDRRRKFMSFRAKRSKHLYRDMKNISSDFTA